MTEKTPREVIQATRDLLSDPDRWFRGTFYSERDTGPCYCLVGALILNSGGSPKVATENIDEQTVAEIAKVPAEALAAVASCAVSDPTYRETVFYDYSTAADGTSWGEKTYKIVNYNDDNHHTHEDILKILDCALEKV